MKKILVIANCLTYGLSNCLRLCCENVLVHGCDRNTFYKELDVWSERIPGYDYIITFPEIHDVNLFDYKSIENVVLIPSFFFSAFHPDTTFAMYNGEGVNSALDGYHSRLILTGYKYGLSPERTKSIFNINTYKSVGYVDMYEQSKNSLIESFLSYHIDIRSSFVGWVRNGMFMHGVNHPDIHVLYDIAKLVAQRLGLIIRDHPHRPHDNLLNGPVFPVYPEIADYYGFSCGSYFFKYAYDYQVQSLMEYICSSYDVYKKYDINEVVFSEVELGSLL